MHKYKKATRIALLSLLSTISITTSFSQEQPTRPAISAANTHFSPSSILSNDYIFSVPPIEQTKNTPSSPNISNLRAVMMQSSLPKQAQYNCSELAFFCRLEVKMEKAAKLPVKFRLGDVQQVDMLEGKYEGWRYGH